MEVFKVIGIIGLFFQISSGFLFLFDFVLKSRETTLEKFTNKTGERIDSLLSGKRSLIIFILVVMAAFMLGYVYLVSKLQGTSFSDMGLPNMLIVIVFGALVAGFIYTIALRFSVGLIRKWKITRKFLRGSIQKRLIGSNVFLFAITAVPSAIIISIIALFNIQQPIAVIFMSLLFTLLGGLAVFALFLTIILLIMWLVSYIASTPKRFWASLLTMWAIGGICLLISAFCA